MRARRLALYRCVPVKAEPDHVTPGMETIAPVGLSLASWTFIEVPCRRGIRNFLSVEIDRSSNVSLRSADLH
jgi:peptidoglycan/LPS O-acetylase OafA/YrhL